MKSPECGGADDTTREYIDERLKLEGSNRRTSELGTRAFDKL